MGMLMDSVFSIREAAVESIIKVSKESLSQEWLQSIFIEKVKEFGTHERFIIRIHALFFINKIAGEVSKEVLNKNFAEVILALAEDPVPNIRFNVSKTIDQIYTRLTPGNKIKCEGALEKMCKDSDFDVHFYAKVAMQKINKM